MDILWHNTSWMTFNLALALLPVLFMVLFFVVRNAFLRLCFVSLWFLFLPNTIYVITDIEHLFWQLPQVTEAERIILLLQYGILELVGLIAFLVAIRPFEKLLQKRISKHTAIFFIISYNFLIGFALVLGKIERVHSVDIFFQPISVLMSAFKIVQSEELLILAILFGLFANCFYFLFRSFIKTKGIIF